MSTETHNGWKNRTTWALHLWLTNDHDTYLAAVAWANHAIAEEAIARARCEMVEEMTASAIFESFVRCSWSDFPTLMRMDVGADLSSIDWDAVVASLTE